MHKTKWEEIEYTYKDHGLLGMKGMALMKWKQARLDDGEKATIKHLSDSIVALDVGVHFICQVCINFLFKDLVSTFVFVLRKQQRIVDSEQARTFIKRNLQLYIEIVMYWL